MWHLIKRPETRAEIRVFLKSETKTDRKPAVKITLQYKLSSAFCEKGKIACKKISAVRKRDLSICCLLKGNALILEQTSRSYGGLKWGLFVTKWGLFVQFQRVISNFLLENPPRYRLKHLLLLLLLFNDGFDQQGLLSMLYSVRLTMFRGLITVT